MDSAGGKSDDVPENMCRPKVIEAYMMDLNGEPVSTLSLPGSPLRSIMQASTTLGLHMVWGTLSVPPLAESKKTLLVFCPSTSPPTPLGWCQTPIDSFGVNLKWSALFGECFRAGATGFWPLEVRMRHLCLLIVTSSPLTVPSPGHLLEHQGIVHSYLPHQVVPLPRMSLFPETLPHFPITSLRS